MYVCMYVRMPELFFPVAVLLSVGHILANFGHIQLLPAVTG